MVDLAVRAVSLVVGWVLTYEIVGAVAILVVWLITDYRRNRRRYR